MIIPRRKPYFYPQIIKDVPKFLFGKIPKTAIDKLEIDLSKELNIPNPVAVSSGRVGLYLILKSAGLKKGSQIIIPGYTFGTLTTFIIKAGFVPVAVDIDPLTFQMSPVAITKAITKKTSAILATHIFGFPCDILKIKKIADKHKLLLIEDCAESMGATVKGRPTGTFGDISISSFNIAKPLQGINGGLIFGKNRLLINKIKKLINSDSHESQDFIKESVRGIVGYLLSQTFFWPVLMYIFSFKKLRNLFVNFYRKADKNTKIILKISPEYAEITRNNIRLFKERLNNRQKIKDRYIKNLSGRVQFQKEYKYSTGNCYMIVIKIKKDPIKLRRFLALRGVDIAIMDEIADNVLLQTPSVVNNIYTFTVALPVYEELTFKQVDHVCKQVKYFLNN